MELENFLDCSSAQILQQLAKAPLDLTASGVLSEERLNRFASSCPYFTLSYATERVTEEVLVALNNLAQERALVKQMEDMQQGAVVNKIHGYSSESRPALHTATRSWGPYPQGSLAQEIASKSQKECDRLQTFLETARASFSTIVQIGIGGSELGPKALHYALTGIWDTDKEVHFVSNIDPDEVTRTLKKISCKDTMVVVVSKSGSTQETSVNEAFFREYFTQQGCSTDQHFVAVTCEGSAMDDPGRYLEVFHLWESIGGRFSSTSMVGGVVLGFAFGFEIFMQILSGAAFIDSLVLDPSPHNNLPMMSALLGIWNRNFLGYPTLAVIPYASGLQYFPAHLQQCSMESNGKSIDIFGNRVSFKTASVLWGGVGTNSQHSFFQCIHQGSDIVPLEFIGFLQNQLGNDFVVSESTSTEKLFANMLAQSIALAKGEKSDHPNKYFSGNRPSSILVARQLTPYILGALLAFYEHKIVFQGFCWGINSFDQEGVSLGKALTHQILANMKSQGNGDFTEAIALLKLFNHL